MSDTPAVAMEDVDFGFGGSLVLDNVTFSIAAGDFVGVVGPNGGGKTTLVKLMLGILKPLRGMIRVFGAPPIKAGPRLGYVPQMWGRLAGFPVTVLDVTLMGLVGPGTPDGPYSGADRDQAMQALDRVSLASMADRSFSSLSGGEEQRSLIARAIVSHPDLLVLDEPTANVDVIAERAINDLLLDLHRDMTIIMVSHDLSLISDAVETVLCVNRHVQRHPTSALSDVNGDLLCQLFGDQLRMVRHDRHVEEGSGD